MSVFGVLGVLFIVLKILGIGAVANWSWWLVLLPLYGGFVFFLALAIFIAVLKAVID